MVKIIYEPSDDVEDSVVISESLAKEMCGESTKEVKINDSDIPLPSPDIFGHIEPEKYENTRARILKMLRDSREYWRKNAIEERNHVEKGTMNESYN